MQKIKYYLSIAFFYIRMELLGQLEYPTFLIGWFFSNFLQFAIGLCTLKFVLDSFHLLNGWSFGQICFLYGLGIITHAISVIIFVQTWFIDDSIIHGEFDRMKTRPLSVFFQFCFQAFNLIGLTDLWPGVVIFIYGCIQVNFVWTLENIIKFFIVIIGATLIRGAIFTLTGSIAFWTKKSRELIDVNLILYEKAMMYPMTLYNKGIQNIFTFLIPLAFITFYPSSEFLGMDARFNLPGGLAIWTLIVGVALITISTYVFKIGINRYESSGT